MSIVIVCVGTGTSAGIDIGIHTGAVNRTCVDIIIGVCASTVHCTGTCAIIVGIYKTTAIVGLAVN